ncbi:uncharacterized protein dbf4b [Mastacembelus armatus]|uniref:DBF4 zinc finger B n=1 Tax=Mastacembelus armatus TaxID=205130 RepID=A0A7N8XTE5_9TELE|nr:uncharacterized protein LOC113135100 [Mastacembelus armatus]
MQQDAEERGLMGKLCAGEKKLVGKTFFLDGVKKGSTALLLEAISLLGGRVESFLHKDVSFVVTERQEGRNKQKCTDIKGGGNSRNEEIQHLNKQQESILSNGRQRPAAPRPVACGSRGKALLEKAIRNNERLQGSSVLANARSWGVKILYVDDVVFYLRQLTRGSYSRKHKRSEKSYTKQGSHVVKATALRSPYLKIEDLSRKYKPLHMQSMTFPSLYYSGRYSPFETPSPLFKKNTEKEENKTREKKEVESSAQDKSPTPLHCSPSRWQPRKKNLSYCECCHQPFTNVEEHLQSDQHRAFVLDPSNYSMVDKLTADLIPGSILSPSQHSEETLNRPPALLPIQDFGELEPLSDVETEHAVQDLRRQGSSTFTHISSPARGSLFFGPASPSPGVQLSMPNTATVSADIQSFSPLECQFPDIQHHSSSPAMPVLDVEPQAHTSASQQADIQHLSPCPLTSCAFPDPYSVPPVLSPQVPYSSNIMEPQNLYSEPPILSPQKYAAVEAVEGVICETDPVESLSESLAAVTVPVSTPLLPSVDVTNTGVKESHQDGLLLFNRIICSSSGLECDKPATHRSQSLPRQSATVANSKKRCRSASPVCSWSKRRRISAKAGHNRRSTEQKHKFAKPEGCLLFDKACCQLLQFGLNASVSSTSSQCTVETLGLTQTSTKFCVPAVQNFFQAPKQSDILCRGSTSVANLPLQFPSNKSHNVFSSQDSQRSLSHSTSVCIESALIPDLATLSPSSSDSDWDCDLLSHLGQTSATPLSATEQSCELEKELLHRPCTWMHDTSYETRLHTVLQPPTPAASQCGEEMDPSAFSRTLVQVVEVQH